MWTIKDTGDGIFTLCSEIGEIGSYSYATAQHEIDCLNHKGETHIYIREHECTFACYWIDDESKPHFSFSDLPFPASRLTKLYLSESGGYAIKNILPRTNATITGRCKGAYGGTKKIVRVTLESLNEMTVKYWIRENTRGKAQEESQKYCHYCGLPAKSINIFEVGVCENCGG